MKKFFSIIGLLSASALCQAQQGHPLDGIWLGDWGSSATERNQVVVELVWRNTSLSGIINPGYPDQATVEAGVLDSRNDWKVHIEAVGTDADGAPFRTVLEGQLDESNLGSAKRTMKGTWTQAGASGDFQLTRD